MTTPTKFKLYHSKGNTAENPNPLELEAGSVEEAVREAERRTGGTVHDASAFLPNLNGGMWIACDIWR